MDAIGLHAGLTDRRRYERQIDRLHERYLFTRHLYELQQDGVPLAAMVMNRAQLAGLLARAVGRGEYRFEPGRIRMLRLDGKVRLVYAFRLTDQVVQRVVADIINEASLSSLPPGVYSYRKGLSGWRAVADFAAYVRRHRRMRPDPITRGLYVLRRDIKAYFDSIPVGVGSGLWRALRELLGAAAPILEADWALVEQVVRPVVLVEGRPACPLRGVATGQPIASVLANLYLSRLDALLGAIPESFYARYADDMLFAHPDAAVAQEADTEIDRTLAELGLVANEEKRRTLYLTAAGRPSSAWMATKAASVIPFLGARVSATGTVGLSRRKVRALLWDLERRVLRTVKALQPAGRERLGPLVCSIVNKALTASPSPFQQPSAPLLRRTVTDRSQLSQLDYWIARIVLRAVTGRSDVAAFREVAYRTIRQDWGLLSLTHARNTGSPMLPWTR